MNVKEKYKKLFGSIQTLSDDEPWTMGVVGILEHFAWGTSNVLGISKTRLINLVIEMSSSDELSHLSTDEKAKEIKKKLHSIQSESETIERYDSHKTGYCFPREALRRNRFFSEDFLNAEFNIFLSLCSDNYLNKLYERYISLNHDGHWSTHGNGGIFRTSSGIDNRMQMDNLAYNETENILVANELKLGGKKNKDQILKYCFMYRVLENNELIQKDSKFLLLFISDKDEVIDLKTELQKEIAYATTQAKLTYLLNEDIISIADTLNVKSLSWNELIAFNKMYLSEDETICQVERKLLLGFNQTLEEKAFMQ